MDTNATSLSKFLSLVLRHKPQVLGLQLDPEGWVEVSTLLAAMRQHGHTLTRAQLEELVASSDKQRFALSDAGARIRANQGHSLAVDLKLQPQAPPDRLFHGTATRFLASIREHGLKAGSRQHVHLSQNESTAVSVGARHGKAVVLTVLAAELHALGHAFYLSDNQVWLTGTVSPAFLQFPPEP